QFFRSGHNRSTRDRVTARDRVPSRVRCLIRAGDYETAWIALQDCEQTDLCGWVRLVGEAATLGLPQAMLEYANHDPDWPSESSALWAAAAVSRGGLAPL